MWPDYRRRAIAEGGSRVVRDDPLKSERGTMNEPSLAPLSLGE